MTPSNGLRGELSGPQTVPGQAWAVAPEARIIEAVDEPFHLLTTRLRSAWWVVSRGMFIAASLEQRSWANAVNGLVRMAGGQCPLKGGAIDHHRCHGGLVNQLTRELTIDHH